jgi:hypothetical protein
MRRWSSPLGVWCLMRRWSSPLGVAIALKIGKSGLKVKK